MSSSYERPRVCWFRFLCVFACFFPVCHRFMFSVGFLCIFFFAVVTLVIITSAIDCLERLLCQMTCSVLSGMFNSTAELTIINGNIFLYVFLSLFLLF